MARVNRARRGEDGSGTTGGVVRGSRGGGNKVESRTRAQCRGAVWDPGQDPADRPSYCNAAAIAPCSRWRRSKEKPANFLARRSAPFERENNASHTRRPRATRGYRIRGGEGREKNPLTETKFLWSPAPPGSPTTDRSPDWPDGRWKWDERRKTRGSTRPIRIRFRIIAETRWPATPEKGRAIIFIRCDRFY